MRPTDRTFNFAIAIVSNYRNAKKEDLPAIRRQICASYFEEIDPELEQGFLLAIRIITNFLLEN